MQEARLWHINDMILFENASLPTSSNALKRVNVLFDTKIIKISVDPILSEEDPIIVDLKGKVLLPGAVDPHLHLLGKKQEMPDRIKHATQSAMNGGWTSVAEMSYNSERPIFGALHIRQMKELIEQNAFCDMALWGNVDILDYPYHAEAAQELWAKGVVGIALMAPSPNENIQELSFTEMMDLFLDIYESDTEFSFQGYDHESHAEYSLDAHMDGIKKILRRMQENPIHIPKVSHYPVIEFINTISKRSDISFALSMPDLMHFLEPEAFPALWSTDFAEYRDLLYELLKTNKIYLLSNSCGAQDYESEVFRGSAEELLSYSYHWVLSELWKRRKIPLATCIKMTSENAAKRLGIYPQKGCLEAGSDADFVIYDPEGSSHIISPNGSPVELIGNIDSVYLRGEKWDAKEGPKGQFIARGQSPKRRHNKSTWI
jgi:allantoinase